MTEQTYTETVDISYDSTPVVRSRQKKTVQHSKKLRRPRVIKVTRISKSRSFNNQVNVMTFSFNLCRLKIIFISFEKYSESNLQNLLMVFNFVCTEAL